MKVIDTNIKGLKIIEPDVYEDNRGWFTESYSKNTFINNGIDVDFVQDNHSFTLKKGTLRGIHFQTNPMAQTKLVRCIRGAIIDVAVDLRKGSDTYKQWFSMELSAENQKQLLIPKGFGHAFITITDNVEVQYKVDEYYSKSHDRSIRYDDDELGIEWGVDKPILSEKDFNAPYLKDIYVDFSIKVLVTGAKGQLGHDVLKRLNELGIENKGVDISDFDIANKQETFDYLRSYVPDVVIHCAAYTAVDKAEEDKESCYTINVNGTKNIAEACKIINAKMVYISSDYVFDGEGNEPQLEEMDVKPLNYYGYTKAEGEKIVKEVLEKYFIVRTSWLYGQAGSNFVKKIIQLAKSNECIRVINDQIGAPTYTLDLAVLICEMIQTRKYGIYHGVNDGFCSWYDFATAILDIANIKTKIVPIATSEYNSKASRPLNSRLSTKKLNENGFALLPKWEDALSRYFKEVDCN